MSNNPSSPPTHREHPRPIDSASERDFDLQQGSFLLEKDELKFWEQQTGLTGVVKGYVGEESELEKHLSGIRREAYAVWSYPCIKRYGFARFRCGHHPAYPSILKRFITETKRQGESNSNDVWLDQGCAFGTDVRKCVDDGVPAERVVGSDLRPEFISLGHRLFFESSSSSTPSSGRPSAKCHGDKIKFVTGDFFDNSEEGELKQFEGRVRVLHTSAFFHLFDEKTQQVAAQRCAKLLSPMPGSIAFGGQSVGAFGADGKHRWEKDSYRFAHTPESWSDLWTSQIEFPPLVSRDGSSAASSPTPTGNGGNNNSAGRIDPTVKVQAMVHKVDRVDGSVVNWMLWSVERVDPTNTKVGDEGEGQDAEEGLGESVVQWLKKGKKMESYI